MLAAALAALRAAWRAPALRVGVLLACFRLARCEEVERASNQAVGIAGTLIGAVSFQMGLFHLTNHSDPDMRKYTYAVINQTVSIFCSVLMFQSCNDVVDIYFLEGLSLEGKFLCNMIHMLFWFVVLQVVLAYVCGVMGKAPASLEDMEHRTKCFATLLAHVTGFASINAWGSLQQTDYFAATPGMSFAVVPISLTGQFLLQRITDCVRTRVIGSDGVEDEFEKKWDEETEEAENDVMALTLSFNLAQALRFWNSNELPDQEGVEEMPVLVSHTQPQILTLWACAAVAACIVAVMFYVMPLKEEGEEEEEEEKSEKAEQGKERSPGREGSGPKKEERTRMQELGQRAWAILVIMFSMTFAWCSFYSAKMSVAQIKGLQDMMILAVSLALTISAVSFLIIRALDILADQTWTGDRVDGTIKQVIRSLGLLVGFGWEQAFDQAVESLSSVLAYPHVGKFVLAMFCILVVVPAWYEYILPMAITRNWEWGFLVRDLDDPREEERWLKVMEHVAEKREKKRKEQAKLVKHQGQAQKQTPVRKGLTMKLGAVAKHLHKNRQTRVAQDGDYVRFDSGSPRSDGDAERLELRKQNRRLKDALAESIKALRLREEAEHKRAQELQVDIRQMDAMLGKIREVEGIVGITMSPPPSDRREARAGSPWS